MTLNDPATRAVPGAGRRALLCGLAAGLTALLAPSRPARAAEDGIAQLRRFTAQTRSARGRFTQQLIRQSGAAGKTSSGEFAFERPGRFRWEIQRPFEQLIVTDGTKLYFYDKDLQQVTVRKATDAIGATPAAVLFGDGELGGAFELKEQGERDGLAWVDALPRSADSGFERIQIGLRDGLPRKMEVRDAFGQVNRFEFSAIEANAAVAPAGFAFTPPPGVDVIE